MIVSYYLDLPNEPIAFVRTQAVSGTHTACVGVMEQLAKNHPSDIFYICAGPHQMASPLHPNLFFTNQGIPEATETLILSTQFGCGSSRPLFSGLSSLKKVVYVCHTLFNLGEGYNISSFDREILILHENNIPIEMVYLSIWSREHLCRYMNPQVRSIIERTSCHLIGNPIISDALPPISRLVKRNKKRIENSFLWAATWERGGSVALRVFRKFRNLQKDATFHIASYFPIDQLEELKKESGVVLHGSLGKTKLYELMSDVETFVYPLVLPNGVIHKDTFGCCVSEALACGCKVVTCPQGTLRELHEGVVDFADIPPEVEDLARNTEFWSVAPWLLSEESVDRVFEAVLRSNRRTDNIENAIYIRYKFGDSRLYSLWNRVVYSPRQKVTYYLKVPFDEDKKGMSGTHTSCKVVMDQLSPHMSCAICTDPEAISPDTETLILSTQFTFPIHPSCLPYLKHVVYVTHMTYMYPYAFEIPQLINLGVKVSVVFLCEWVRSLVRHHLVNFHGIYPSSLNDKKECSKLFTSIMNTFENQVTHHVIGNPLPPVLPPVDLRNRIPHSYVYSATWERGGEFALKVFRKIKDRFQDAIFHIASYHDSIPEEVTSVPGVVVHGSLSKDDILNLLSVTDTMLYPTTVHKDTFSCTVSEAVACGCRVVTYSQGALGDLYLHNELVDFVPVPPEVQANSIGSFYFVEDPWFVTHEADAVEGFAKVVVENEKGHAERVSNTLEIRKRFSAEKIGEEWMRVLSA